MAPTRRGPDHLLDVFAADPELCVLDLRVDDASMISDHRLVVATIAVNSALHKHPVAFSYRRIRDISADDFDRKLRNSSLFFAPAATADGFAEQMRDVVVAVLDEVAPLRNCVRRPPKAISKFLSKEAVEAKRYRRRLERRWLKSRRECDYVVYRRACRHANNLINMSRRNYFHNQLLTAATPKDR